MLLTKDGVKKDVHHKDSVERLMREGWVEADEADTAKFDKAAALVLLEQKG